VLCGFDLAVELKVTEGEERGRGDDAVLKAAATSLVSEDTQSST